MEFETEIIEIRDETYEVKTFRVRNPSNFSFIPGQYCLVELDDISKPFTFSNIPKEDYLELTIKKLGEFTSKLFELSRGDKLKINGPMGETLNFNEDIKDNIVFIAGGSGITPFISSIRYIIDKNLPNKVVLLYSNRTREDIIYKKELDKLKDNIKVVYFLTRDEMEGAENQRINKEIISKYIDNVKDMLWYVCGPPRMNSGIREILKELNINKDKIRIESWEIPGKK